MPKGTEQVDVVVVGAGTAGAGAALQLARRGLSVVLVERRPADAGGAQWHNGVLDRHFEEAGLEPPAGPERHSASTRTHIVTADGTPAVTITSPTVTADMALLGKRLRSGALEAGAELIERVDGLEVVTAGGRPVAVHAGARRITADLFVDASGRSGVLRRHSPALVPWCPPARGGELCSAADVHLAITDPDGARRFVERHGAEVGETITMVGVAGGFSTCAVTVDREVEQAKVLVGCLADGRHGTARRMLGDLRRREPWLGDLRSGGFGVIPLRRPYARFTAPGLALVGDAACQVFPAHGSGIGIGLVAGRMLADAVSGAHGSGDPGDESVLWRYQHAFQRELGGLLLASDVFRRLTTALGSEGVHRLARSGLMTATSASAALDQRWPAPPVAEVAVMARRLAAEPRLARRMLPRLAAAQAALTHGRRHPGEPDEGALARWDRRSEILLGRLPG